MKNLNLTKWMPLLILALFILSSCSAGDQKFNFDPAGFWMGLWHGFISMFTFIISLFNENVNIYEFNNTGKLYDLGFILGIAFFYGGSSKSSCKRW